MKIHSLIVIALLAGCEGSHKHPNTGSNNESDSDANAPIAEEKVQSFELVDPNASVSHRFAITSDILSNKRALISSRDSSIASNAGAFHLYDLIKQERLASIMGDEVNEATTSSFLALPNGDFIITSSLDTINAVGGAGSVKLFSGETGKQTGAANEGDNVDDGVDLSVHLLSDTFVISRPKDDVGAATNAGSVVLVSSTTGDVIRTVFQGDQADDGLDMYVEILENGNFAVIAPLDDNNGLADLGSIRLFNGVTGVQIGSTIRGVSALDKIASNKTLTFASGNFVSHSQFSHSGFGALHFVNGTTGSVIEMRGAHSGDMNAAKILELKNGNFAIGLPNYDVDSGGLITNVGLITVMTPAGFFSPFILGDQQNDKLGSSLVELTGGNFVAASRDDDVGMVDNGSVRLISYVNGRQIGATLSGDNVNDYFGSITALPNGSFVLSAPGSLRLISGDAAEQIGSTKGSATGAGDNILKLPNGNYFVGNPDENAKGLRSGAIQLYDGSTGGQVGATFAGEAQEGVGDVGSIRLLPSGNVLLRSTPFNGSRGRLLVLDSSTGLQLGPGVQGKEDGDAYGIYGPDIILDNGIIAFRTLEATNGAIRYGAMRFMSATTGAEIDTLPPILGTSHLDALVFKVELSPNKQFMLFTGDRFDTGGVNLSGRANVISLLAE